MDAYLSFLLLVCRRDVKLPVSSVRARAGPQASPRLEWVCLQSSRAGVRSEGGFDPPGEAKVEHGEEADDVDFGLRYTDDELPAALLETSA